MESYKLRNTRLIIIIQRRDTFANGQLWIFQKKKKKKKKYRYSQFLNLFIVVYWKRAEACIA